MKKEYIFFFAAGTMLLFFAAPAMAKNLDSSGKDCEKIGIWSGGTKTCSLTADVHERIQIDSGITLEGNGHSVIGYGTGYGIYIFNETDVVVRNIKVENFESGIGVVQSTAVVTDSIFTNNKTGIYLAHSVGSHVSKNAITSNGSQGIKLYYSDNNTISENTIENNGSGIYQTYQGSHNLFEKNNISGSSYGGIVLHDDGSSYNKLIGNSINSNATFGINLHGSNYVLSGNIMEGNGENFNLNLLGGLGTNEIDATNMVEGKKVFYIKNAVDEVYGDTDDIGQFLCINCKNVTLRNAELSGNNSKVFFYGTTGSLIENVKSPDKSLVAYFYNSPANTIKNNDFSKIYLYGTSKKNSVYGNNFWDQDAPTGQSSGSTGNVFHLPLPTGGNYWKMNESACDDADNDGFCDSSFYHYPTRDLYPLAREITFGETVCQENCFSSVMFLPGIKASRLYKDGIVGTEDKLWPPNYFGNDLEELYLDENGKSIERVYTRDAVDEVGIPIVGGDIYKTFLEKLSDLKKDEVINDYDVFAYDWRQNVEDIAKNGTPYSNEIKSAIEVLEKLAETSKSEKVTIIAHSNGGLLAKAIMLELENRGLNDKVDKIVFAGTPQMGTPLAVLSMLYGYDESALLGTLISREDSRVLAENMPGAYGLLPSEKYFERMNDPFITFSSLKTRYKDFVDAYGEKIGDFDEFEYFLLGKGDGREKPDSGEVEKENILNEDLMGQAIEMHKRLDNWIPPQDVQVVQIAGWGLDTVSGIEYTEKEKVSCVMRYSNLVCLPNGEYEPIYEPKFTVDGDKVVVAPSALMLAESPNVKRYWVDLYRSNKIFTNGREHKDILEFEPVENFINRIIINSYLVDSLPNYISVTRPIDYKDYPSRVRMSLYSPLDIHLYDEAGNHTGPKLMEVEGAEEIVFEEGIPNSYYYQFGERKYVGFSEGENIRVELEGYDMGAYTLKLEEIEMTDSGEQTINKAEFENLPTTDETLVSFEIPESGLADMTKLEADMDNDGRIDYEVDKVLGGKAVLLMSVKEIDKSLDGYLENGSILDEKTWKFLKVKMDEIIHIKQMIDKMEEKEKNKPRDNEIRLFNKKIDDLIGFIWEKFDKSIGDSAKGTLIDSLNYIKIK
ncbi:MAG TPA: hypothetical protein DCX32_02705 [Candidatus Moranbacteria bacterium]|nr:hypothetical protein [Candidatus Moranbacteria bacterium]